MTDKDQAIGGLICTACIVTAIAYTVAIFWPPLAPLRLWLVAIPVLIAFLAVLAIGAWIGWTMATTPPPKPIEDLELEDTTEEEKKRFHASSKSSYRLMQSKGYCRSQSRDRNRCTPLDI